jgi:hypothetical protein
VVGKNNELPEDHVGLVSARGTFALPSGNAPCAGQKKRCFSGSIFQETPFALKGEYAFKKADRRKNAWGTSILFGGPTRT